MAEQVIRVSGKSLDIAPRKLRIVIDGVRGMPLERALTTLQFMPKRGAKLAWKVIRAAKAAAEEARVAPESLAVQMIRVDGASATKNRIYGSRGRAALVKKQKSHLLVQIGPQRAVAALAARPLKRTAKTEQVASAEPLVAPDPEITETAKTETVEPEEIVATEKGGRDGSKN